MQEIIRYCSFAFGGAFVGWLFVRWLRLSDAMLQETIKYYILELLRPFALFVLTGLTAWLAVVIKDDFLIVFCFVAFGISFAWFVVRLRRVILAFYFRAKCYEKMENSANKKGVHAYRGGNRTGKSLNGYATLFYKALALWRDTVRYYALYDAKKRINKLSSKEYLTYKELREDYKFYTKHSFLIPHLVTNVKVTNNEKQESMDLTGWHLLQIDKLPCPAAVGLDESSNKVDIDVYLDDDCDIVLTNFIRFFNHYTGDGSLFIFMEQNSQRAFKGFRDSIQEILTHKGVETLLKPVRLMKKIDRMFNKFETKLKYHTSEYAIKILALEAKIKRIGVLQLNFTTMDEPSIIVQECLPCDTPFNYDNRFFRTGYLSRDDELKLSKFAHDLQAEDMVEDTITIHRVKVEGEKDPRNIAMYRGQSVAELWRKAKSARASPILDAPKTHEGAKEGMTLDW